MKDQNQKDKSVESKDSKPQGKTNMVKLRNVGKGPYFRPTNIATDKEGHVTANLKRSKPQRIALYDGNNPSVQIAALGFAGRPGNPKADPPVFPIPPRKATLVPIDAEGRAWLKDVRAAFDQAQHDIDDDIDEDIPE